MALNEWEDVEPTWHTPTLIMAALHPRSRQARQERCQPQTWYSHFHWKGTASLSRKAMILVK